MPDDVFLVHFFDLAEEADRKVKRFWLDEFQVGTARSQLLLEQFDLFNQFLVFDVIGKKSSQSAKINPAEVLAWILKKVKMSAHIKERSAMNHVFFHND